MTYKELALKVLTETAVAMTPAAVWSHALTKGYDKLLSSVGKTPVCTLGAQLYMDVKRPGSSFTRAARGKFTLVGPISPPVVLKGSHLPYRESELHPFLVYFARHELECYTKTVVHTKSTKDDFGDWVHPDIVGCRIPTKTLWDPASLDAAKALGELPVTLLSFELKREVTLSNLREVFFQAVSNSSWAHEGYLVAAEIDLSNLKLAAELNRLNQAFGIGLIVLDYKNPDNSVVHIAAHRNDTLDWETINKLCGMNADFRLFLTSVTDATKTSRIAEADFDRLVVLADLQKTAAAW